MNEELYHHGILGQKWGIRRFQNSNGSLTLAGKRRYNVDTTKKSKAKANISDNKKLKGAIAGGATLAVASLAVIGALKISQVKNQAVIGHSFVNNNLPKISRRDAQRVKALMEASREIANQRISQYGNHYFG